MDRNEQRDRGMSEAESVGHGRLLCSLGDLAPGAMKSVDVPGLPKVAVYNVGGEVFATSNVCTHQVALLTDGYLDGDCVECPMHGGSFNVRTGAALAFPCAVALQTFPVQVVDGGVYLVGADAGAATA